MSKTARYVVESIEQLRREDSVLKYINLHFKHLTDSQVTELVYCLLTYPNVVTAAYLNVNQLTDETGVKLAQYLAASSTIEGLDLSNNQFSSATYLAVAAALRVNSSLKYLNLYNNQAVDQTRIDAAFVEALRLNPVRPARSMWYLYSTSNDFKRLKDAANILGSPSMISQLDFVEECRAETKIHTI